MIRDYIEGVYIVRPNVADQSRYYLKLEYFCGSFEMICSESLNEPLEEISQRPYINGRSVKQMSIVDYHVYISKDTFCKRYRDRQAMIEESLDGF